MHQENQVLLFFLNYFIQEHFKKEKEGNCQNNRTDLVLQLHVITRADGDVNTYTYRGLSRLSREQA